MTWAILIGLPLCWGPPTPANVGLAPLGVYDRIHLGMTLPEVTAAIGVPPGRYDGGPNANDPPYGPYAEYVRETGVPIKSPRMRKLAEASWIWSDYWVAVAFDGDEKVVGYYLLRPGSSMPLSTPHEALHPTWQ